MPVSWYNGSINADGDYHNQVESALYERISSLEGPVVQVSDGGPSVIGVGPDSRCSGLPSVSKRQGRNLHTEATDLSLHE